MSSPGSSDDLPGDGANVALQDAVALGVVIGFVVDRTRIPAPTLRGSGTISSCSGSQARGECRRWRIVGSLTATALRPHRPIVRCAPSGSWASGGLVADREGRRRQDARWQIADLRSNGPSWLGSGTAGDQHQLVVGRKLHHLAGRQQRPRGLLAGDHQMAEPGLSRMAGIVFHRRISVAVPSASETRLAVRSSLVAKVTRTWQLSRIELFCP